MSEDKRSIRVTFKGGLTGRLFKVAGSDRWYLSYWHTGQEYRETTKTADFDAAKATLKNKLQELAAVRRGAEPFISPTSKRLKVGELLDALEADLALRGAKGLAPAKAHMKPLREAFAGWRALEVTPEAVDRQIEQWLAADVAPATINRRTQLLHQAFRLAHQRHRIPSVPTFRRLRENNARQGFLEPGTFQAIVAALPEYLRDLARLGHALGWRKSELLGLTAANVDLKLGELRLSDSKNGEGRVVPLRNEDGSLNAVGEVVQRRMAERVVGDRVVPWLFHRAGKPIVDYRKAWATACVDAGAPGAVFHDLRRTFARDGVDAGNDYKTIMDIGGWKTVSTFHRYKIVDTRRMAIALSRTHAFRGAQTTAPTVIPLARAAESVSG